MAEESVSQSHKALDFFNKMLEGQIDHVDAWYDQVEKWQSKGFEQAEQAVDNAADLTKATMTYAQDLTRDFAEMQKDLLEHTTAAADSEEA